MTQLNIGNKGCENLESKQESLPVIFRLFLSSFFLSLSPSLVRMIWYFWLWFPWKHVSGLFGWTVQMWMMPSQQWHALKRSMDQRRKIGERTSHSPKISLHGNSMEKYVFCDNIVFNDMPIYTCLFCILCCLLLNRISFLLSLRLTVLQRHLVDTWRCNYSFCRPHL